MNIGEYDATTEAAKAGVATWMRSAPTPRAPYPTSAGAPVYGPPAITRTRPFWPLWLAPFCATAGANLPGPLIDARLPGGPSFPTRDPPACLGGPPPLPPWSGTVAARRAA